MDVRRFLDIAAKDDDRLVEYDDSDFIDSDCDEEQVEGREDEEATAGADAVLHRLFSC
jgi:hypothetical protein